MPLRERVWVAGFALAVSSAACFSEEPQKCPRGDRGCRCLEGLCEDGFVCSESDYCLLENCTPGEVYCSCDAGMCTGGIECFEGDVCRPEEPVPVSDTEATGEGSGSGTSNTTSTSTATSEQTTGSADCTPGEVCGPCRRCDGEGDCEVDVGMPCDGETIQCADYLWGLQDGVCYLKAAEELAPRCDAFGECSQATVDDCSAEMGDAHVSCDPSCLDAPATCAADAPAATVSVMSMCVEAGTGPDCQPICFNGSYSEISYYECSNGACVHNDPLDVDCGPYACENDACNTSCAGELDCAMFYYCELMTDTCEPE